MASLDFSASGQLTAGKSHVTSAEPNLTAQVAIRLVDP